MSKKKKGSNSQSSFSFKNFLVMHVEKVVFGFIALIASIVMYVGFSAKPYSSAKTPEKLKEQATQVSRDLKVDHWTAMKDEEGRKVDPVFTIAAGDSRKKIDPIPYIADPTGSSKIRLGAKRGDPAILAPEHLEAKYYLGPIATWAPKVDPLAILEDAKKVEVKQPKNASGFPGSGEGGPQGAGKGGGSSSGGSAEGGLGMGGGAGMGMGMGMGNDPNLAGRRVLFAGYDRGFNFGMSTFANPMGSMGGGGGYPGGMGESGGYPGGAEGGNLGGAAGGTIPKAETRKIIAKGYGFVCVTALAPHHEMETNYRKEFYDVIGYMEGRDSPNYRGFEVQRVEITDPNKEIAEKDWQALLDASPEKYKEAVKYLVGTCSEINPLDWTDPNLSMPIPPILLNDYRKFATHSKIKYGAPEEADFPGMGGMGSGFGEGGGMPGGYGDGGYGDGGMGPGGMGPGGMGAGGMGAGSGSSGSGMPGGYGEGGGMSSGSGSGGMTSGFTEGSGSGYGGGYGGGDGGLGNAGTMMEVPRRLPSTKYKLIRFYDFKTEAGKIYKYRVRLLMYDSNFPEWSALKPASSTLKTETLRRVQTLESEFKAKESAPVKKATNPPTVVAQAKREKYRETEWSAPSKAVLIKKPAMVFAAETKEKLECVLVDFEVQRGISIPKKDTVERGFVFGTPNKQVKSKDVGIDIIHPVTKVIKALKDYRATNFVTVVDWKSPSPLNTMIANPKDAIKTGAEVVSFDPITGQLVVSREFDNFTSFNMYVQPDLPAVGPLGGGLSAGNANGMSGGYGESGPGGMGMGSPGMGSSGKGGPGIGMTGS